jgi:Uma2 family endonuclease
MTRTPAASAPGRWTYEEFAKLPEDGKRYEVIAGELYVTPRPWVLHQYAVSQLGIVIFEFVNVKQYLGTLLRGPVDVLFADSDVMAPDLLFVRKERESILTERAVEGAPDLVVEVVSEVTEERDRGIKRERYAHYGVPEYWIVDADRHMVEVCRVRDDTVSSFVTHDSLSWQPVPDGPVLTIHIPELLRKYDELRRIVEENKARRRDTDR